MTAPSDDPDVVRQFSAALTPAARRALAEMPGYDQIRCIHAACRDHTPAELARIVSAGIGRYANPAGLIAFRLRRLSGLFDEEEDA